MARAATLPKSAMLDVRRTLSENGAFDYLAVRLSVQVPANIITQTEGNAPFFDPKYMLGSKDIPAEIGYNAAVPKEELQLSNRQYRIRKLGFGIPHNRKKAENELHHDMLREQTAPAIAQRIGLQIDGHHLAEIMTGEGLADDSRDVTIRSVPVGEKWDTDDSEFLEEIEAAKEDVQKGVSGLHADEQDAMDDDVDVIGVFGKEVIRKVKQTAPLQRAFHGGEPARIPTAEMAAFIENQTGLDEVIIGNKSYQDGSVHQKYEAARLHSDTAFVTAEGNIGMIPYADEDQIAGDGGPDIRVNEKDDPPVDDVIGDWWVDLIVYFPPLSVSFQDKWS